MDCIGIYSGRGAISFGGSAIERERGRKRRENVGMSSESAVRICTIGSPRFPEEGSSAQGKSGPKPRPKGVGDGQPVEIPVLLSYIKRGSDTGGKADPGVGRPGPIGKADAEGKSAASEG